MLTKNIMFMEMNSRKIPNWLESKSFYVDKFVGLVILNAPEYEYFGIPDVLRKVLDSEDINRYWDLADMVKNKLLSLDVVEPYGSWQFLINEDVRQSILNPKKQITTPYKKEIHIHGNNYAPINQDSSLSNSQVTNSIIEPPKTTEAKSNWWSKIFEILTNNKLISTIVFAIIVYVLTKFFGIKIE